MGFQFRGLEARVDARGLGLHLFEEIVIALDFLVRLGAPICMNVNFSAYAGYFSRTARRREALEIPFV